MPSCWAPVTWHQQATWRELQLTIVYFDHDIYYDLGQWEDAWQTAVSAHEWGHNLNLEDHSTDQCSQPNLIMGQGDVSHPPCLTGPTWAEADSVAQFYGYWGDGDPDLDGFSNDVENYVGTGPRDNCSDNPNDAAWPPDITNDRNCDVSDVLQYPPHLNSMCGEGAYWRRLDLSTDCAVDVSDVLALLPYLNTSCQ